MSTSPLISIITVCYNAAHLLEPTLQSAIHQTYKNIELIIVDGQSKDNTLEVLKPFKPYIGTLISEPDKGIYDAMNKGIQAAKGEWLYFLNAGDSFYNNQVLEQIFGAKQYNQAWLIYGKVQTVNEPTGINYLAGEAVTLSDFYRKYPICHQATFTAKEAFNAIGLYHIQYKLAADTEWFARLFLAEPTKAVYIDEVIAFYDIQGATYHKRMQGYREYIQFGFKLFPNAIAIKNLLNYPLLWIKVKLIRLLTNTALFKKYRELKFKNKKATYGHYNAS